jgi:P27 family predicted phage terminase small subunit
MARRAESPQSKVLQGKFRSDRDSHGPAVPTGLPACPSWLPRSAKKHWREVGEILSENGLISLVDGPAFALFCDSYGRFEEVSKKLKKLDDLTDLTPQNYMVQSTLFTIRNKLWDQAMKAAQEFGFTPAARSKIKTPNGQQLPLGGGDGWGSV